MWEQDPSTFLEDVSLLPLATLAAAQSPEQLLNQVSQRVSTMESTQQRRECCDRLAEIKFIAIPRTL
jgi:predicted transposase YdaD